MKSPLTILRNAMPSAGALLACRVFLATAAFAQQPAGGDSLVTYLVPPAATDSAIYRFTEPNYVVFDRRTPASAPLLVFLPGTGGRPQGTSDFANLAARQGYRVIGLEYTDVPAVAEICPRSPDPGCSERVRQKRIFGTDVTALIDDRAEESVVHRLAALLLTLQRDHPDEGWNRYLANGGVPEWSRIAVSGLSQGAGMAAYIAQQVRVARVILFSSPWDNYGRTHVLAPWITRGPGQTPSELWFAAYHEREATASIIASAYAALRIPREHIRVFTLDPSPAASGNNPNHPSVVNNRATPRLADGTPAYLEDWRFLLGEVR